MSHRIAGDHAVRTRRRRCATLPLQYVSTTHTGHGGAADRSESRCFFADAKEAAHEEGPEEAGQRDEARPLILAACSAPVLLGSVEFELGVMFSIIESRVLFPFCMFLSPARQGTVETGKWTPEGPLLGRGTIETIKTDPPMVPRTRQAQSKQ